MDHDTRQSFVSSIDYTDNLFSVSGWYTAQVVSMLEDYRTLDTVCHFWEEIRKLVYFGDYLALGARFEKCKCGMLVMDIAR